ncbi:MAG: InlB B-repeat-containing protein [Clostridia bacterium]|nr:InlB B-repeat-containing protein [Clostridia bacterium]
MKKTKKSLALILILLLATALSLTACNLSRLSEALRTDISLCDVSFSANAYEYTGQAIRPDLSIKYVNKVLELDVDYSVEYSNNIEIGKGLATINGIGKFKGQTSKEFDIVEKVDGNGGLPSGSISSGDNGEQEKKYITYTFSAQGAEVVSGKLTQKVQSVDEIIAPTVKKLGYDFLYWTYQGDEVNFDDKESLPQQNSTFTAEFSIVTYTIDYVLDGGDNDPLNKNKYTVEDAFILHDASRDDKQFAGWYLDSEFEDRFTSLSGVAENLVLYAKFVDFDYKQLSYVTPDGVDEIPFEMIYPGAALTRPAQVLSADGSQKLVWYIDEDMTVRHNLRNMPNEDLTLYARFEDKVFTGFLDKGWYKLTDIKSIDSYEDLIAYVEFIYFYNITQPTPKKITYVRGSDNIMTELAKALGENTFPKMLGTSYRADSNTTCSVWMSANVSGQATLAATEKEDFYPQIGHVFNNYNSNRAASFDDFAINYVQDEYKCTTSDQLFYVLSHGYKPLPTSGSQAYRIYNKFKEIMRSICDDRMTDLQKARAIFDWLVINVYYDNNVAYTTLPQASYKYNAFYLEGVLNGAAVCDGLSKAYAVMCAIEGIDCVRVTGKLKDAGEHDAGHAWNKLQIMGQWYLSDATWGNRVLAVPHEEDEGRDYYEYVNGKYFLFTDYERSEVDNYNSDQYSQYVAKNQYNYYDNYKMQLEFTKTSILGNTSTYIRTFDLYIDGDAAQGMSAVAEMSYVFEYIDKSGNTLDGMSFCVMLGENMSTDKIREALTDYVNRVDREDNGKAKIRRYRILGDVDDIIDPVNKIYRQGAIITIVISLPPTNTNTSSQNAA